MQQREHRNSLAQTILSYLFIFPFSFFSFFAFFLSLSFLSLSSFFFRFCFPTRTFEPNQKEIRTVLPTTTSLHILPAQSCSTIEKDRWSLSGSSRETDQLCWTRAIEKEQNTDVNTFLVPLPLLLLFLFFFFFFFLYVNTVFNYLSLFEHNYIHINISSLLYRHSEIYIYMYNVYV